MEAKNLNAGILAEELVSLKLLELGYNVARPVQIGPIDLLSIWSGKVIKRLQIKSRAERAVDRSMRYEFSVSPGSGSYAVEDIDFAVLVGVETKSFWVIPMKQIGDRKSVNTSVGGNAMFDKYFDAWKLLQKP